jgi:hypothetical protein
MANDQCHILRGYSYGANSSSSRHVLIARYPIWMNIIHIGIGQRIEPILILSVIYEYKSQAASEGLVSLDLLCGPGW